MQHSPVRGKGSNQFADKPPALVTAPPPTAGGQQAAAGVATASPFAQQPAAAPAAGWKAELDGLDATVNAELQTATNAAAAAQRDKVEQARAFLAESPEPAPGHSPVYHEQARRIIANEGRDRMLAVASPAADLARSKQRLIERARTDTDQLAAAGLPSDAVIMAGPNDRDLADTVRRDPDTGRYNVEIHHDDGTVEHMTGTEPVADGQWSYHSSIVTDRGNTYWRQRRSPSTAGGYAVEGTTKGNWPDDATIIVRRPFDTTVDTQPRVAPNVSRTFGW